MLHMSGVIGDPEVLDVLPKDSAGVVKSYYSVAAKQG